uniref:Uncharacterized protein n=1 Tax=Spongospora subterranea TaxID=70186 RepID=A0A0H5QQX7_9EUKA|eukprot:CRZ04480.1 hypothetical protein [Spongospora subterranea]
MLQGTCLLLPCIGETPFSPFCQRTCVEGTYVSRSFEGRGSISPLGDPKKYGDETTAFFVTAVLGIDVITINVFGEVFRPSVMMLDSTDPAVRILVRLPLVNAFVLHHTFGKSNQWHLQSEIACQRNQLNHFGALLGSESLIS